LTIAQLRAADAACFIGHDVQITGWEDVGEGFGGVANIYPIVLAPEFRMADAQFVARPWAQDPGNDVFFVYTLKGSGVAFDQSNRNVLVTARLGVAAAEGCKALQLDGWTWAPPDSWAQHRCDHLLVIKKVVSLA
jgi:hypothetical protein